MYPREEARKGLERDVTGFKLLQQAFQEIIDKTSRRIEEVKYLGKEIYGVDLHDVKSAGAQFQMLLEKGEGRYLDWARLIAEGMMLEEGRERLKRRKMELELMLKLLKDTLGGGEKD